MKRLKTSATCITLVALAAAGAGRAPANAATKTHSLAFTVRTLASLNGGTELSESERVISAGKTVGFATTDCVLNLNSGQATCDVAMALAAGMVYAKVKVNGQTGHSVGSVTGGTRAYAAAKGTVTGKPGSRATDTIIRLVYRT